MLIADIRKRLQERLDALGEGPKTNFIKQRLREHGLGETYLDQVLNIRREDRPPLDPPISKLESLAKALEISLPWLIFEIGRPEAMYAARVLPAPTAEPETQRAEVFGLEAARRTRAPKRGESPSVKTPSRPRK